MNVLTTVLDTIYSNIATIDQAILIVILTAIGGIVIKLLDIYSKKDNEDISSQLAIRSQVFGEIERLHAELDRLRKSEDDLKEKYWNAMEIKTKHTKDCADNCPIVIGLQEELKSINKSDAYNKLSDKFFGQINDDEIED